MEDSRPMIHVRLPKPLVKRIDHVGVDWDIDRARTIEKLLELALEKLDQQQGISELQLAGVRPSQ